MSKQYYGPTGNGKVSGYRMSPVEHQLRIDFALGGRDNGLQRALDTLKEEGRRDLITGTRDTYERAIGMLDNRNPVNWNINTVVEEKDHKSIIDHGFETIAQSELASVANITHFGINPPEEIVVMHSPASVSSSNKDKYYAWSPTDEGVSICLCPAKCWQQDNSVLCKHEIAALVAMSENKFNIADNNLDAAKTNLVGKNAYKNYDTSTE